MVILAVVLAYILDVFAIIRTGDVCFRDIPSVGSLIIMRFRGRKLTAVQWL